MPEGERVRVEPAGTLRAFVAELDFPEALQAEIREKPLRIVGASLTATGTYLLVHTIIVTGGRAFKALTDQPVPGSREWLDVLLGQMQDTPPQPPEWASYDPVAFGAGLMAGGMILAGQNPGEVLAGIGAIIDGLIPG